VPKAKAKAASRPASAPGKRGGISAPASRPASAGSVGLPHGNTLLSSLMDPDSRVRTASMVAIKRISLRTRSRPVSSTRAKQQASREARGLVSSFDGDDRLFARVLAHRLEDADPKVRSWTANALGVIGTAARSQAPALQDLLSEVSRNRAEEVREVGVMAGATHCIASFPGAYLDEWEGLGQFFADGALSSACVFLPRSDHGCYGQHCSDPETPNQCYCRALYGARKPWGCQWFALWQENVKAAVQLGLTLLVVFHPGQAGTGVVEWDDLARLGPKLWNKVGLGGSQKGEVAWLRRAGYSFVGTDVTDLKSLLGIKEHKCMQKLKQRERAANTATHTAAAKALSRIGAPGPGEKKPAAKKKSRGKSAGGRGRSTGKSKSPGKKRAGKSK